MHDSRSGVRGANTGKPRDQPVHLRDRLGFRRAILLAPPPDLPRHIALRLAEIGDAQRGVIELVQPRDGVVQRVEQRRAVSPRKFRRMRLPEHPALGMFHHIEGRADHVVIGAEMQRPRHRKSGERQRLRHAVLALDRMGRGQQLAEGLAPQHIGAGWSRQLVGRVRLPALESRQRQRPGKAIDVMRQIALQRSSVDVGSGGAGKRLLAVNAHGVPGRGGVRQASPADSPRR